MSCLALNASFEPLTIVTTRRAVRLVLDGKAELLESDTERVFRSEDRVVPCPAVIRLVRSSKPDAGSTVAIRRISCSGSSAGGCRRGWRKGTRRA